VLTTQNIDPNEAPKRRFILLRWVVAAWHWIVPPTQAHSDRESDRTRMIRAGVIIGACLSLVVLALMYMRPLHRMYKTKRAEGLVQDARRFADKGDVVTAVMTAQEAYRIAPEFEPGIRLNAQLLTSIGAGYSQKAIYYWELLGRDGTATLDDHKGMVRALLRSGREKEARQQMEMLIKDHPTDASLLELAREVWGQQQTTGIVLEALKKYVKAHPEDRAAAQQLANIQIQSGVANEAGDGRKSLWELAQNQDQPGLDALRNLADLKEIDIDERKRLAALLDAHPLANGWDRTKALTQRVLLNPENANQLIDELAGKFATARGAELEPFIRWLVEHKEYGRVVNRLDISTIKKRTEDQPLLLNYLNAITMLGRIAELERLVNDREVLLKASVRAFYQVHLGLIKRVDRDTMQRLLTAARVTALNDGQPELLLQIAFYCMDKLHDHYSIAEQCYTDLTTSLVSQRYERFAYEQMMICCRHAGHTDTLASASARASERWPDDMTFLETTLYVNLLRGHEVETTLERAVRLLEASPEDPMRKIVCAFGYYRLGDFNSAIRHLQGTNLKALTTGRTAAAEGPSVTFAQILMAAGPQMVAGGDVALFRKQLASVLDPIKDNAPLLPEERRTLLALRRQADLAAQ